MVTLKQLLAGQPGVGSMYKLGESVSKRLAREKAAKLSNLRVMKAVDVIAKVVAGAPSRRGGSIATCGSVQKPKRITR